VRLPYAYRGQRTVQRTETETNYGGDMSQIPIDIEEFYEANEARRESSEFEFGSEWTDAADNEYELSWVEATGELYLMLAPDSEIGTDAFGDFYITEEDVEELTVLVIATIGSHEAVLRAIDGWEDAMLDENSIEWLYARLRN